MPQYRVTAPDGRSFIVNAPEGATRAQALAYARKHMVQPNAKPRAKGTGIGWLDNTLSSVNEAVIGAGEGLYNAASAVTDPIAHFALEKLYGKEYADRQLAHDRGQRRALSDAASRALVSRPMPVARDAGRIAVAALAPGPKIAALGKAAPAVQRAVQGAIGGATVRDVDDASAANEAIIGAGGAVVLPPVIRRIAKTAPVKAVTSAVGKAAAPVTNWLVGPSTPQIAQQATRPLEALGRKAEARAARFRSVGVDEPTTAMVTRNPTAFKVERKLSQVEGAGDDLSQQLQDVEQSLVRSGQRLVDRMGGAKGAEATGASVQSALQPRMNALTAQLENFEQGLIREGDDLVRSAGGVRGSEATGRAAQAALDAKRGEMQQVTSRLYDKVREERGDDVVGELPALRDLMDSPDMLDNAVFDQMRESLSRRMARLGGRDSMDDLPGDAAITVRQAEELRKFIRSLGSSSDPAVRMMRGQLIDALDDDVVNAVGDDAFKAARASAKARFDEFSKTFAGRIADEGIAPERLTKRVLSDTTSLDDLRAMRRSLLSGTEEQIARGQEAWQGLRAQALNDLISGATGTDGKIIGKMLERNFAKGVLKFRELLSPQQFDRLQTLVSSSQDRAAQAALEDFSNTLAGRITGTGVEDVTKRALTAGIDDLRSLKNALSSGSAAERAAWKDLQAQGVDDLLKGAISDEGAISGMKLLNAFKNRSANLRVLLDPADYKELRRLVYASRDATVAPPTSSAYGSDTAPMLINLLEGAPQKVRSSWLRFLGRVGAHGASGATMGPMGNVALEAGRATVASAAQQKAANILARRVEMARNPEAAANAIAALRKAGETNPAASDLLQRYSGAVGGTVAAQ